MSDCPLCRQPQPGEIWRNKNFYVIDAGGDGLPGYIRLVCCGHVKEMTGLSQKVRLEMLELLTVIERIMIAVMAPDKVNLASLGNMVPHLHWHIIARWADDAYFPDSIWSAPRRAAPDGQTMRQRTELAARMVEELKRALEPFS